MSENNTNDVNANATPPASITPPTPPTIPAVPAAQPASVLPETNTTISNEEYARLIEANKAHTELLASIAKESEEKKITLKTSSLLKNILGRK